ncbi:MAG: hypothetical protein JXL97_03015 [Bacteroidales bacterium]|nr:hypothetical protein [Bacteroidales bacterium]
MKKYLAIIFFIIFYSCSEQAPVDKTTEKIGQESFELDSDKDSLMVFLIYGELAPAGYLDDENPITEEYGFKLKRVAGCEVDEAFVNDILKQNNNALIEMNKKYGDDWIKEFEKKTNYKLAIPFD